MRKSPRSAATEHAPERIVFIDMLEREMLDLKALRKQVAEAETRFRVREDSQLPAWALRARSAKRRSHYQRSRAASSAICTPSMLRETAGVSVENQDLTISPSASASSSPAPTRSSRSLSLAPGE